MSDFIEAYDKRTGKKLPSPVPNRWIDHPVLGRHLSRTPKATKADTQEPRRSRKASAVPVQTNETPALGDNKKE